MHNYSHIENNIPQSAEHRPKLQCMQAKKVLPEKWTSMFTPFCLPSKKPAKKLVHFARIICSICGTPVKKPAVVRCGVVVLCVALTLQFPDLEFISRETTSLHDLLFCFDAKLILTCAARSRLILPSACFSNNPRKESKVDSGWLLLLKWAPSPLLKTYMRRV